jgi:hypothetical protein
MLCTDNRDGDLSEAERVRLCTEAIGRLEARYEVDDKWKKLIPYVQAKNGELGAAKYFGELGETRAKDLALPPSLVLAM